MNICMNYIYMHGGSTLQSYDFVELWAGTAWTTTMVRKSGRNTAALDKNIFRLTLRSPTDQIISISWPRQGFCFLACLHVVFIGLWFQPTSGFHASMKCPLITPDAFLLLIHNVWFWNSGWLWPRFWTPSMDNLQFFVPLFVALGLQLIWLQVGEAVVRRWAGKTGATFNLPIAWLHGVLENKYQFSVFVWIYVVFPKKLPIAPNHSPREAEPPFVLCGCLGWRCYSTW